jgi:hypothetical protein
MGGGASIWGAVSVGAEGSAGAGEGLLGGGLACGASTGALGLATLGFFNFFLRKNCQAKTPNTRSKTKNNKRPFLSFMTAVLL